MLWLRRFSTSSLVPGLAPTKARKPAVLIFAQVILFVLMVSTSNITAEGQVSECQKQCTSSSPEAPCFSFRGKQGYENCVTKCKKECTDCTALVGDPPHLALNLYTLSSCPSDDVLSKMNAGLIPKLNKLGVQHPDIHSSCKDGYISFLIWTWPPADACHNQARQSAQLPSDIASNPFGFFIAKQTLAELAQSTFDSDPTLHTVPADPGIHLTHLSVDFLDQWLLDSTKFWCKRSVCGHLTFENGILTEVNGYDEQTTPSTNFGVTIVDVLTTRNDCFPATDPTCGCLSDSKISVPLFQKITAPLTGLVGAADIAFGLPIGSVPDIFSGSLEFLLNQPSGGSQVGAGCTVWRSLPDEVALPQSGGVSLPPRPPTAGRAEAPSPTVLHPQRNKLVITYGAAQPQISVRGLVFIAAKTELTPRTPVVQIQGPSYLTINRHDVYASATYRVLPVPPQAADFFGALTYQWTVDQGGTQIVPDDKNHAQITFVTDAKMKPGTNTTQTVKVKVTDSEGSFATATLKVEFSKLTTDPPPPKPNPPPQCKQNPTAKECTTQPF